MNKRMRIFLTARNSKWNLTVVILILLGVVLGCSDGGDTPAEAPKKTVPPAFIGTWTGQDGSTVTFRNDWSGDYKSGGKSVSGGAFEIDEAAREIRFTLLGFDAGKYKIDAPPKNNRMKLDGMEYRRTGGFDASDADAKPISSTGEIPSERELRPVVNRTLIEFDRAIRKSDFSEFCSNLAGKWREQITPAELDKTFAEFCNRNLDFAPKNEAALIFSPAPSFEDEETLKTDVNYANAAGKNARFRLRYIKEDDSWKLVGINLNPQSDDD